MSQPHLHHPSSRRASYRAVLVALILAFVLPAMAQDTDKKLPVPDADAQAKAEKLIKDLFKDEYAKKKPPELLALVAMLLDQARETKDDAAARFVLFREARDLAAQAGDTVLALKIVDELAKEYAVNSPAIKALVLEKASGGAVTQAANKSLVESALAVLEEALIVDDFEAAGKLLKMAEAAATKAKMIALVTSVQAKTKVVEGLRKEHERIKPVAETLAKKPDDLQANVAMGKYLCFLKGNWEKGLPMLAQGSDEKLKELAKKELAVPTQAGDQADLGDGWWDLSEMEQAIAKTHLQRRAYYWYQQAGPQLTGLTKTKVEKRLKVLGELFTPPAGQWDHLDVTKAKVMDGFLRLEKGENSVSTKGMYKGGLDITVVARTEKDSIRLMAGNAGGVIFNWESNPKELRVGRPNPKGVLDLGTAVVQPFQPKVWYTLRWQLTEQGMDISVNGKTVFSEKRPFDLSAEKPVQVGNYGSAIDIRSITVKPLK